MILYAPFAIFYIKVASGNGGDSASISYSVVAESVAVFLGTPSLQFLLTSCRYSTRGCHHYSPGFVKTYRTSAISTTFHKLDIAPIVDRFVIYHYHSICISRSKRRPTNNSRSSRRSSLNHVFCHHLCKYLIYVSKIWVRVPIFVRAKLHCCK